MPKQFQDLDELQHYLKAQAQSNGYIELSDAIFDTRVVDLIDQNLGAKIFQLVVQPSQIPPPKNSELKFDTVTPQDPQNSFLNLSYKKVGITFTLQGSQNELNFDLDVTLGNWQFGDSYIELVGLTINDLQDILSAQSLSFTTLTSAKEPLTYEGKLSLSDSKTNPLADVLDFIQKQPMVIDIVGAITQTEHGPAFDLQAHLFKGNLDLAGLISIDAPWVGVQTKYLPPSSGNGSGNALVLIEDDPDSWLPIATSYVGASVNFKNSAGDDLPLLFQAFFNTDFGTVTLLVTPLPSQDTQSNVGNLDVLIGPAVQEFADLFGGSNIAEDFRKDYLSKVGLKSFSTEFSLKNRSIDFVSLTIGSELDPSTGKPKQWILFGGALKFDFDLVWIIMNPTDSKTRMMSASLDANLVIAQDYPFHILVEIPSMNFVGAYTGQPVKLSLVDAIEKMTGIKNLPIPSDLLTLTITGFSFAVSPENNSFSFMLSGDAGFRLFNTNILTVTDAIVSVNRVYGTKGSSQPKSTTVNANGIIGILDLKFDVSAVISSDSKIDTVFTIHMVDQTIGSLLQWLIHLVDPYFDLSFGSPWNKILDISLDALVLTINVSQGNVSLQYGVDIDLGFVTIKSIGLTYQKATKNAQNEVVPSKTEIAIDCEFLGISYGDSKGSEPLAWNPVTQAPPSASGGSKKIFELKYLGFGQHVTPTNVPTTMLGIIEAMQKAMVPSDDSSKNPSQLPGLKFNKESNWLIAAQFTVLDTVSIAAIFNDPDLYGIRISLAGERAKSFAGLAFEILYKKVTATIGLYHIELTLPAIMRNLQFGVVSITLPIITLDIYTNANFRIDFGFPKGLDFSNSFSVQVFPFIGYAGFYFAYLTGATSTTVPKITNGQFNPVIEFGFGLSIGVGKTIEAGVLSAGVSITVVGIIEGTIAWFEPNKADVKKDTFYKISGLAALVGKLFGKINFVIIQIDVEVVISASLTFVIESYQPIYITATAKVTARASIKIIFFTIHFSFSITLTFSFTIGSKGNPPWKLASPGQNGNAQLLRHQRAQYSLRSLFGEYQQAPFKAKTMAGTDLSTMQFDFSPQSVTHLLGEDAANKPVLSLVMMPAFTIADSSTLALSSASSSASQAVQCVLIPFVQNSIPSSAQSAQEVREMVEGTEQVHFNQLVGRLLAWAIQAIPNRTKSATTVTLTELEALFNKLTESSFEDEHFNYKNLTGFIDKNFSIQLETRVDGKQSDLSGTVFPMLPALTMTANGSSVDFGTEPMVTEAYRKQIEAYLNALQVQYEDEVEKHYDQKQIQKEALITGNGDLTTESTPPQDSSMATLLFQHYFVMLARAAVQAAIDFLKKYMYRVKAVAGKTPKLTSIANSFSNSEISYRVVKGDTLELLSTMFDVSIDSVKALNSDVKNYRSSELLPAGLILSIPVVVTPLGIVNANQSQEGILQDQTGLPITAAKYQIRAGESLLEIASKFNASAQFQESLASDNSTVSILEVGAEISLDHSKLNLEYTTQENDTIYLIASSYAIRLGGPSSYNALSGLHQLIQDIMTENPHLAPDASTVLDSGLLVKIPTDDNGTFEYYTRNSDTVQRIAATWLVNSGEGHLDVTSVVNGFYALNSMLPANRHAPLTSGTKLNTPTLQYHVREGDIIREIMALFGITSLSDFVSLFESLTDVLALGAVLSIPKFVYSIQSGDKLGAIANNFNLSLAEFTKEIEAVDNLFIDGASITIPHVPAIEISALIETLINAGDFNQSAAMVSRFFLHGLRLPTAPGPIGQVVSAMDEMAQITTGPLYELDLQQISLPVSVPLSYSVLFSNSAGSSWLDFSMSTYVTTQVKETADTIASAFLANAVDKTNFESVLRKLNPSVTAWNDLPINTTLVFPGASSYLTGASDTIDELSPRFGVTVKEIQALNPDLAHTDPTATLPAGITVLMPVINLFPLKQLMIQFSAGQRALIAELETTTFSPDITRLQRMPLYRETAHRYSLAKEIHWQTASLPANTWLSKKAPTTGEPTIWPFSDTLLKSIESLPDASLAFELMAGKQEAPNQPTTANPIDCYMWGTLIDFKVRTIPIANGDGSLQNSYHLVGSDQNGRDQLQLVWDYVNNGGSSDQINLAILYPPNPTSANPGGLASNVLNTSETFILKTNLSTLSQSGPQGSLIELDQDDCWSSAQPGEYDATMDDAKDFIKLLWECSVVYSGGFYFNYMTKDAKGLPDSLFSDGNEADLSLLVLISDPNASNQVPHIHAMHNCAVIGENLDASETNIFVQPILHIIAQGDTLTKIANDFANEYGYATTPAALGEANATVEGLLQPGATMLGSNHKTYIIQPGDTFAKLVPNLASSVADLATANSTQTIFEPGALVQFIDGQLKLAATVPPGNVGFEMIRPAIAPPKTTETASTPVQDMVENLFQLLGFSIEDNNYFTASGEGLPAGPQDNSESGTDGLTFKAIGTEDLWIYKQAFPVYKFSKSASDLLGLAIPFGGFPIPDPKQSPYLGIEKGSKVDVGFEFQDIYGNQAITQSPIPRLSIPVGYTDDLIGVDQWPSVGSSYYFTLDGATPYCRIEMGLELENYIAGTDLLYDNAIQNAGSHLERVRQLYYQLAREDVAFTLLTSLDQPPAQGKTANTPMTPYAVDKQPLFAFVSATHVFLNAATNLNPWLHAIAVGQNLVDIAQIFSISVPTLAWGNAHRDVTEFIASPTLELPEYEFFRFNGTLTSLGVTEEQVVQYNLDLLLNTDIDLDTSSNPRSYKLKAGDTLRSVARNAFALVAGIATANTNHELNTDITLYFGTQSVSTDLVSSLGAAASHFSTPEETVSVAEVALANQDIVDLFSTTKSAELSLHDYVTQENDTFQSIVNNYPFDLKSLITANLELANIYPIGAALQTGTTSYTIETGDTLANIAYEQSVTIEALAICNESTQLKTGQKAILEIPAQVVIDPATPPASTFPLQHGDQLSAIAKNYINTTATSLITLNRETLYLFEDKSSFEISGITVAVESKDTFSSLYDKFVAQKYSGKFEDFALAAATAIDGGQWIFLSNALLLCPPMILEQSESLSDLSKLYRANILSLMNANRSVRGFLNHQGSLTFGKFTIHLNKNQTMSSVLNQLNALSHQAGLKDEIRMEDLANDDGVTKDKSLLNGSANPRQLLVPAPNILAPFALQSSANELAFEIAILSTPVNPKKIFPVVVDLMLARTEPDLIDPGFVNAAAVRSASSLITPMFSENKSDPKHPSMTLLQFAEDFESAFDGLKLGTGQPSESADQPKAKQLWAVDFRKGGLTFNIQKGQDPSEPNPNAKYYSMPPMATSLKGSSVEVRPYVSGKGLGDPERRTFQGVDLDVWTKAFLEAVDLFLDPGYAIGAYALSSNCYECVVQSKGQIAQYISERVASVFDNGGSGNVEDAQEALRQRLLIQLSNAYKIDTIVQLPVEIGYEQSNAHLLPPRLSGKPVVQSSSKGTSQKKAAYGISTAKVPVSYEKNEPALSTLNFLLDVKDKASQKNLELDLTYSINEMEYDISNVANIDGYQGSSWLTFIIPIGSAGDVLLKNNAEIGILEIPVPLRSYPSMPSLEQQFGTSGTIPSTITSLQDKIDVLKTWAYNVTFAHTHASQDTRYLQVTFPEPQSLDIGAAIDPLENLFEALAQFTFVYSDMKSDLALLPLLASGETNDIASIAVQTFGKLVCNVEQAWASWKLAEEILPINQPYFQYMLNDQKKDSVLQLSIVSTYPEHVAPYWPEITADKFENGYYVNYKLKPDPIVPGRRDRNYTFPAGVDAKEPRYTFEFPDLDVTINQSADADIWVKRNENLGPDINHVFVYKTPEVGFPNQYVPLLIQKEAVNIRQPTDQNPGDSIENVLSYLLPSQGCYYLTLTCRYGYEVAAAQNKLETPSAGTGTNRSIGALTTYLPVLHFTKFQLAVDQINTFATQLNTQLSTWTQKNKPSKANGSYCFQISLYAGQSTDDDSHNKPLLELENLYYTL